jgi:hypothetical protein
MTNESEPLDAALWFDRIEIIARGELGSVENSLRHAGHLLQLTPRPFRHAVRLSLNEAAFEVLLDGGDFDTAARHLVAQPTVLSVDESTGGPVRASISCVSVASSSSEPSTAWAIQWLPLSLRRGRVVCWLSAPSSELT